MQCGYCTPGMIMAGVALLPKNADPDRSRDRLPGLDGNICRCGTYPRIIAGDPQGRRGDERRWQMSEQPRPELRHRARTLRVLRGPTLPFELDRREFLEGLGGGIVVCLCSRATPWPSSRAARARRRRRPAPARSAPGCTSARTARSPSTPARSRSARTSARR